MLRHLIAGQRETCFEIGCQRQEKRSRSPVIRNPNRIQRLEKELLRRDRTDIAKNFRIVDAMFQETVALGILPLRDSLEGLEVAIRIARAVNCVPRTTHKNIK